MKNTKLTAWILAAVLCCGTVLAGCGKNEKTEEPETVEGTVVMEEESMQEIGDPTAPLKILLTNEMGNTITGMSIKSPSETEYPDNIMTADQEIEDGETVKLFYEPVTEADFESSEGEAVKPDADYIGSWNEEGYDDCELTISDVSDDTVTFHIWWYHAASTEDSVVATFDSENVGSFSTFINGDKEVSGTITFYDDSIEVRILKSASEDVHVGTLVFDERHDSSWENGDDFTLTEENTDADSEETSVTESTYSLQATIENGDVYEFSGFDIEDMEEVTLYLEDGVAYIEYMSVSKNVLINTKEREQEIKADKEAAQAVIDMIAAIGTVTAENAEEHRDEIEAAREAYDTLTDAQKAYVTNLNSLEDMEHALNAITSGESEEPGQESSKKIAYEGEGAYIEGYELGAEGYYASDLVVLSMADNWKEIEEEYDYPGAVDEFWDGFYDGMADYEEGRMPEYANTLGMNQGQLGHSIEEAEAVLKENLGVTSSSPYYQDFIDGYNAGHAEYESDMQGEQGEEGDGDEYEWGMWCAEQGMTEAEAEADAAAGGLTSDNPHYQDFWDGYYDGR